MAERPVPLPAAALQPAPVPGLPSPPGAGDLLVAGVLAVVDRLQATVAFETESLARHVSVDLAELGRQKRQGMLELSRAMRALPAERDPPDAVVQRLAGLSQAIEKNRAVLEVQLGAVREVADIIARVIKDADWDGTYSMRMISQ